MKGIFGYPFFMNRILIISLFILSIGACTQNDMAEVAAISNDKDFPLVVMKGAIIEYTDSAVLKAKIASGKVENFMYFDDRGEVEDQKLIMTKGVKATFFDPNGGVNSILTSQRATRFEKKRITEIESNVVVVNEQGDSLSTEYLLWDEKANTLSSDKKVRVKTKDEIIFAEGFESDVNFTEDTFKKVTGTISLGGE